VTLPVQARIGSPMTGGRGDGGGAANSSSSPGPLTSGSTPTTSRPPSRRAALAAELEQLRQVRGHGGREAAQGTRWC
jgi:hypothetical protein